MTIVLTRASDQDFMDVSYYFYNDRNAGTQQPKTSCDVEYYGLSSPKNGTVIHPSLSHPNVSSSNARCKQYFIPTANQAVIITLNSTLNETTDMLSDMLCTTECGDQGCRCASKQPLESIDHLLLVSRLYGNTLACLCGNNRDWLPVKMWSTTPVYVEWSRTSQNGGLNLTAAYEFVSDGFCGNHDTTRLNGEIRAGYSHNFTYDLNQYYQQKCTYIIDSPPNRELIIMIESSQNRPCNAWNLTVHEFNKTYPNSEGPRLHTFCPRDIARNFTITPEIRSVIVKSQSLGRTAPKYILRWQSLPLNSKSRNKQHQGILMTNNIAMISASNIGLRPKPTFLPFLILASIIFAAT